MTARIGRHRLWIFDADGTLRRTTTPGQPCPRRRDEWELLPRVRETLGGVPWNGPEGPWFGLASNQDQVGAGIIPLETARGLLRDLARRAAGVTPPDAAVQLCPHRLDVACDCRKPRPGMLRRIMACYGIAPEDTVFVGDSDTDQEAARGAGVRFLPAWELFGWRQLA